VLFASLLLAAACATATGAPARSAKLTPAESKWLAPLVTEYTTLAKALAVVNKQELAKDALVQGTTANTTLTKTLATFVACKTALTKARKAPTARLKPFLTSMTGACGNLDTGANTIARAVGAVGQGNSTQAVSLLKKSQTELQKGSTLLGKAGQQAVAVSGGSSLKS
jgi:hypothetical protein